MIHNPNINKRPYRVVDYDPDWPKLFAQYSDTIRQIFGDAVLEIHHFGSTSIPGMFAKPNIDIYVLVSTLDAIRGHKQQMEAAGFATRGDYSGIGEEYFTLDKPDGERIASIHVFEGTDEVFTPYKNLKDYLISHDEEKNRYIALKKDLYQKFADDYPAYDSGKEALLKEIIAKANAWALAKDR